MATVEANKALTVDKILEVIRLSEKENVLPCYGILGGILYEFRKDGYREIVDTNK